MDEPKLILLFLVIGFWILLVLPASKSNSKERSVNLSDDAERKLPPYIRVRNDIINMAKQGSGYKEIFVLYEHNHRYREVHIHYKNGDCKKYCLKEHHIGYYNEKEMKELFKQLEKKLSGKYVDYCEYKEGRTKSEENKIHFVYELKAEENQKKKSRKKL